MDKAGFRLRSMRGGRCAGIGALLLGCAALVSPVAYSAPVTLVGDTVSYVYDDAQASLALFGTPTITGDVVRFLPGSFRAESLNGAGIVFTSATFVFDRVYTHSGNGIRNVRVRETGDYRIFGDGEVSADLSLLASNNNNAQEFEVDTRGFSASGESGLESFDYLGWLTPDASFDSPSNDIALSIGSDLIALSLNNGEAAWVQKKLSFAAISEVPLPAAGWLFMSAMAGLLTVSRRRTVAVSAT